MTLPIKDIQKLSLIDYPGKLCATIFLGGCNFRCPYCYNVNLVLEPENLRTIPEQEVLDFLSERKGFLDGICVGGGEPTIHEELPIFLSKVKKIDLLVKVDTNGSKPKMLKRLIDEGLVDYIAMDVKAPLRKYRKTVRAKVDIENIKESIGLIRASGVDYEFRITVVPGLTTEEDLLEIAKTLKSSKRFVIQQFRPGRTLDESFKDVAPYSIEKLDEFRRKLALFFKECKSRY